MGAWSFTHPDDPPEPIPDALQAFDGGNGRNNLHGDGTGRGGKED